MFLDYFALFLVIFVILFIFYAVIVIHDIPYEISVHRNHPHQDAIHVAGWVSLFTLHALWPFLWIWSMLYREDRGWGFHKSEPESAPQKNSLEEQVKSLTEQVAGLQARLDDTAQARVETQDQGEES